jgi:chromate transporter
VTAKPSFAELLRVFTRIGCLSFGGPAGQIALMHKELVDDRQWIDDRDYLNTLNFCHFLPGPEAQQLATFIGWRLHGVKGGLAAGLLFVIPGAFVILALSILYAYAANLGWFAAMLMGVKAAVLAIVVQAVIRIGKKALDTPLRKAIAVAAFMGLFFLNLPFPLIVLGAGALGIVLAKGLTSGVAIPSTHQPSFGATIRTVGMWLAIWATPLLAVLMLFGQDHVLWNIGTFFSQLAVVTFGGAYAVLAYMAQEAVNGFGWLKPGEMADGLGLAETTPGPLIMVTQFVGFLAAFRDPGAMSPLFAGILGAGLTTWVTFAPCFLFIFTLAPWVDRIQQLPRLRDGLAAISAAVVGVIANLSLWFALHIVFRTVGETHYGPIRVFTPDWGSFDWRTLLLAFVSAFLVFRVKMGIIPLLGLACVGGVLLSLV